MAIKFKKNCKSEWASTEFAEALYELYVVGEHLDNMKKIALDVVKKHADVLLIESNKEEFAKFNEVLEGTALGADTARACVAKAEPRSAVTTYWCQLCSYTVPVVTQETDCILLCPNRCRKGRSVLVTS